MNTNDERRVRRQATKAGLTLTKARYRNPHQLGYGGYMLVDPKTNINVMSLAAKPDYTASLQDVDDYLKR